MGPPTVTFEGDGEIDVKRVGSVMAEVRQGFGVLERQRRAQHRGLRWEVD